MFRLMNLMTSWRKFSRRVSNGFCSQESFVVDVQFRLVVEYGVLPVSGGRCSNFSITPFFWYVDLKGRSRAKGCLDALNKSIKWWLFL